MVNHVLYCVDNKDFPDVNAEGETVLGAAVLCEIPVHVENGVLPDNVLVTLVQVDIEVHMHVVVQVHVWVLVLVLVVLQVQVQVQVHQ